MPATVDYSKDIIQFYNCRLLRNHQLVIDDLWVQGGRIMNPEKLFFDRQVGPDVRIDCNGQILAPGFIDIQINGAYGIDFSDDKIDIGKSVQTVAKGLLSHGVTSFCPTLITNPDYVYHKILPQYKRTPGGKDGAGVLGVHLEGPFISPEKKGAHPLKCIRDFEHGLEDVEAMYGGLENVSIVTLAPEKAASDAVIRALDERGVCVALGHSMANLAQGERAVKSGARLLTHLFNAMLPFHHRDPHLVGLLASDQLPPARGPVHFGIIADGVHTHAAALRIAFRTHPRGLVLVTDAMPAMGLQEGTHHMGQQVVEIRDNRAVVAGTDTLCGSIATMNQCVQFFYKATDCSAVEALEAASLHPAQALRLTDAKGTLDFDSDADFILLDDQLDVRKTFIGGELVWERS